MNTRNVLAERRVRRYPRLTAGRIVTYIILIVAAVVWAVPLLGMLLTSAKTMAEISGGVWALPSGKGLKNFADAWVVLQPFIGNSLAIAVFGTLLTIACASLTAYGVSRRPSRFFNILFFAFCFGMAIPFEGIIIPLYILAKNLGLVNTVLGVILIETAFGQPMFIFILRNFFSTIPAEIKEAAEIDGCSEPAIYLRMVMPLSTTALAAVGIFQFTGIWNDFFIPLIFLQTNDLKTVMLGVNMLNDEYFVSWGTLCAGALIALVPCIIIFLSLQKFFVRGVTAGAMKA